MISAEVSDFRLEWLLELTAQDLCLEAVREGDVLWRRHQRLGLFNFFAQGAAAG